jgi:hypothetical protein
VQSLSPSLLLGQRVEDSVSIEGCPLLSFVEDDH